MSASDMTELDRLPPDQRAVLSLVLDRGKSYGEVAEMLAIPESAVRDRAHAALDALAHESASPSRSRPPARVRASAPAGAAEVGSASRSTPPPAHPRSAGSISAAPSSRTAGALLLGAIVAVIVVAVILISKGGGGKSSSSTSKVASGTQSTSTTSAVKPVLDKTITLTPSDPTLKESGTAYVLSESGRRAFYVGAQGLPPSSGFFYAVWLYNSPSSSKPLGRASNVGSDGRMQGGNPLPTDAALYHQLIVTRETSTHPKQPGPIVLKGTFALR